MDLDPEVARRAYYAQAPWKRIVVILAGPGVNILIAFLLFWVGAVRGQPQRRADARQPRPVVQTLETDDLGRRR